MSRRNSILKTAKAACLSATVAGALLATTSLAHADGYSAPRSYAPAGTAIDWSGFYVGVHAGWAATDADTKYNPAGTTFDVTSYDGIYGGHIGYQRQLGVIVLGIEAGISATFDDNKGSSPCPDVQYSCSQGLQDYIFTVGGRLGFAAGHLMPYLTLGYAHTSLAYSALGGPNPETAETDHHGIYAGAGLDWMIRDNWILGIEYRNYRFFDEKQMPINLLTGGTGYPYVVEPSADSISVRLSYKFGHRHEHYEPLK